MCSAWPDCCDHSAEWVVENKTGLAGWCADRRDSMQLRTAVCRHGVGGGPVVVVCAGQAYRGYCAEILKKTELLFE